MRITDVEVTAAVQSKPPRPFEPLGKTSEASIRGDLNYNAFLMTSFLLAPRAEEELPEGILDQPAGMSEAMGKEKADLSG